jgi:chromosome segregation protein
VDTVRQSESEKQIRSERAKHLAERTSTLTEQISNDRRSNERTTFALQGLENEKAAALQALEEARAKAATLNAEYERQKNATATLQTEADTQRMQQRLHQEVVFQLNKDSEIRGIQIASFRQELERTTSDSHQQSASLEEFEKKLHFLQQEIARKNAALDLLKNEETAIQDRIQGLEKTIELIREEMTDAGRKLDARQNEYSLTKSLVENLEGFPEAIKFLKQKAGWARNAPLLSDIITCSEEFRVPIENYLEPYLNYYVVEHEAEAYEAINILSDAAKGKANFFILDAFERFDPSPASIYPNAYPATQIVEFDAKYRKLMSYILDKVYVVEGDLRSIPADDTNTFLTKSGKFTRRRFSLSGGSVGLFEGKKIGRARNLEKLDKEIKQLTRKLDEVRQSLLDRQRDLDRLRNNDARHRVEEMQNELRMVNEEYVSVKTKQEQFAEMLSSAGVRREDILEKIAQLESELSELKPRAVAEKDQLAAMDLRLTALGEELRAQSELLTARAAAFNEQNLLVHQQESRVGSLDQETRFKQEALELGNQRITANTEELQKAQEEIKAIAESILALDAELLILYSRKEELERGLNEAERDYYQARGQIDQAEKDLRELQHSRENIDTLLMELQHQLGESQLELNSIKERLSVEFRLNPDEILQGPALPAASEEEEKELREEVMRMREKLDNFGPINPMAMEAFTEIKERNDFIVAQKEDLLKAKESLFNTIAEIENVASHTFMEAFMKIREHFIHVFRQLFNEGDDCDLKLIDPKSPLESEIDIIAKPKGKRPLSINQLSGGEKTLTATALLFSMYLLKPAPFCIFDEVDAPLDDANIDKFNTIIRSFSKDSQFVIVTHNKRTMTSTDVIYGITMVEKGISRVVPVDLRELA